MYKGIEWLKDRILRSKGTCIFMRDNSEPHGGGRRFYSGMLTSIDLILGFIDQLDEPEVLPQEWIDEYPHSIQKLIHDYEYKTGTFDWATAFQSTIHGESEETEVKKDKEYLRSVIQRRIDNLPSTYEGLYVEGSRDAYDLVLQDIDQLDEPEVLSQEWIHENKEMYLINDTSENAVPDYKLRNLLVPEQELPVIPKFVAEWITNHREKFDLYPALKKLEGNPFGWERTYEWYRVNTHEFVNVYLTGEYEVEEEQKYYVLLGNQLHDDNWTYALTNLGSIEVIEKDVLPEWDRTKLTEQEIKDYDERYWAFAEPVE